MILELHHGSIEFGGSLLIYFYVGDQIHMLFYKFSIIKHTLQPIDILCDLLQLINTVNRPVL